MSTKYPGGVISKTAPVPSGPYADSTAPGIWTLEQQAAYVKQGNWPTAGNVNPNAFIENLFSTYLYTGTGAAQTITNGIDLSTNGGLVWIKPRTPAGYSHWLYDTIRGVNKGLNTDTTGAQYTAASSLTAFNTTGFNLGSDPDGTGINSSGITNVSWTFREQPKFFDVVTWTGTGSTTTIAHNLGSVPGCIIVKRTDTATNWVVYHRSLNTTAGGLIALNLTNGELTDVNAFNSTVPTSTVFTVGSASSTNGSGGTFVAYVFAHDAGGFGTSGSDNVISCGSYTGTASTDVTVNLGYEPQWVMIKRTNSSGSPAWWIGDTMRGLNMQGINRLEAWDSAAEGAAYNGINPTSTGFVLPTGTVLNDSASSTYIYIAIRRGPMAVPTVGTSVYQGTTRTGTGASASISGLNFPPDAVLTRNRDSNGSSRYAFYDKLRGPTIYLDTAATDSEFTVAQSLTSFNQTGESFGTGAISNYSGDPYINWQFRRAPSYFDEVCYTGTGSATTFTHNLSAVPELMIVKYRAGAGNWVVYNASLGNTKYLRLNSTTAEITDPVWNNTTPTSTVFSVGSGQPTNGSGATYVAYLFATCAGVSKVGSYTGTGAAQTINCSFTSGARFVLIKRTDSTGDWYVWDSARGIIPANDPYLLLNSAAAEVTGTDYIDTTSVGFDVTSTAPAAINANGGTFIFLAIA